MDLDGARNAKLEILQDVFRFSRRTEAFAASSGRPWLVFPEEEDPVSRTNQPHVRLRDFDARALIAMGIRLSQSRPDEHRLVLFCQSKAALESEWVEEAKAAARGEARAIYTGPIRRHVSSAWEPAARRPLMIGSSVAHRSVSAGSVACFVQSDRHGTCLLSNNHVLANSNRANFGDPILQPGRRDGGRDPTDRCGTLADFVPLTLDGKTPNLVDAAIAVLTGCEADRHVLWDPAAEARIGTLAIGPPADATPGAAVRKIGRTTGYTEGEIVAVEVDNLRVAMSSQGLGVAAVFDSQIVIGARGKRFSKPGDSGSLIWDDGRRSIGLLFAGSEPKAKLRNDITYTGLTYANPLSAVFAALDVKHTGG